jgi:hypothetical protein
LLTVARSAGSIRSEKSRPLSASESLCWDVVGSGGTVRDWAQRR